MHNFKINKELTYMSRSMVLIAPYQLSRLYKEFKLGVPVRLLVKKNELPLSPPTLSKLLNMYDKYIVALENKQDQVAEIINYSLFPPFVSNGAEHITGVVVQPDNWIYTGKMPLGIWVKIEDKQP